MQLFDRQPGQPVTPVHCEKMNWNSGSY